MACAKCSRHMKGREKETCACELHATAQTPKHVTGAAVPTKSKFAAIRLKIATALAQGK